MTVWIILGEYQNPHFEPGIEGVFATQAAAVAHRDLLVKRAKEDGKVVFGMNETDPLEDESDWQVSFTEQEQYVHRGARRRALRIRNGAGTGVQTLSQEQQHYAAQPGFQAIEDRPHTLGRYLKSCRRHPKRHVWQCADCRVASGQSPKTRLR